MSCSAPTTGWASSNPCSRVSASNGGAMNAFGIRAIAGAMLAAAALNAPLHAQVVTIDPGMTREQVVAKLGPPLSARSFQTFTYLLYRNGCEKRCGMNDLVTLDGGKVVDAVFRAPGRRYSGTSSSPRAIPAV